jgi:hypothetical protein
MAAGTLQPTVTGGIARLVPATCMPAGTPPDMSTSTRITP